MAERGLNKEHKRQCEESSQSKITLAPDGTTGITSNKNSKYNIEDYMPLVKTPRLDLYFDNSELRTFSLLNCACLEFLCKSNEEYCPLKVTPYNIQDPPTDLITTTTNHGKGDSKEEVMQKQKWRIVMGQ